MSVKKCIHNISVYYCKSCGGQAFCEHGRKTYCRQCGGKGLCEHDVRRSRCVKCKGGNICEHKSRKDRCKKCNGREICEHRKMRWCCRICSPRGWANVNLDVAVKKAKSLGYAPPKIGVEEYVKMMKSSKRCGLCDGLLDWNRSPHLHHNHVSGQVIGFCHAACNTVEGWFKKMSDVDIINFIIISRPSVITVLKETI
jgi:hypothetical protein